MKKVNYFLSVIVCLAVVTMTSCSDDHDHADCHECHIAQEMSDGSEMMWEISNSSGGEDFCGSELSTVEDPEYMHTVTDTLTCTMGNHLLPPGEYGEANGYEIHCEDHGDHDDDD